MADQPGLDLIAAAVRGCILQACRPDSCIETTRVLIGAARYFGYPVRPLPVGVRVYNPLAWELSEARVPPEEWPEGAWSVGIDGTRTAEQVRADRWNGHLIGIAPGCVIDASADQFSRPALGIELTPLVLPRPPGWPECGDAAGWAAASGTRLVYLPGVADPTWRTAPAWRGHEPLYRAITGAAIRAVRIAAEVPA